VAKPVFAPSAFHQFNADAEGIGPDQVIDRLLEVVPKAGAADYARTE